MKRSDGLQRFISEDPILRLGYPNIPFMVPALLKTPSKLHAYNYTGNNPVNFADPRGLIFGTCVKCDEQAYEQCMKPYKNSDACEKCKDVFDDPDCAQCFNEVVRHWYCFFKHCRFEDCKKKCK